MTYLSINDLKQLRFKWRMHLAGNYKLALFYQLVILNDQIKRVLNNKDPRERVVGKDTELVIDGFQGSANSFATAAFRNSQKRQVKMAHHLHSPAQIIEAAKLGTPIILFVREPVGAVLSLTSRWSYISVSRGLKSYIDFYSRLKPFADSFIASNFEQTTQHFDVVVEAVNRKFATNFDLVNMDQAKKNHMPSQTRRKEIKQQKKREFDLDSNQRLIKEAQAIYQNFELLSLR